MRSFYLLAFLCLSTASLLAQVQAPTLVDDFNSGDGDGVSIREVVTVNGTPVFYGNDGATGTEPTALIDGELTTLLDVNTGPGNSFPRPFLVSGDTIAYFIGQNPDTGYAIYQTNGRPEGTRVAVDAIDGNENDFIQDAYLADNGYLYFSTRSNLYRWNGGDSKLVANNLTLTTGGVSDINRTNKLSDYTSYQDGIAAIHKTADLSVQLVYITDTVSVLHDFGEGRNNDFFVYGEHLEAIPGGLIVYFREELAGLPDDRDLAGTFTYETATGTIRDLGFTFVNRVATINDSTKLLVGGTSSIFGSVYRYYALPWAAIAPTLLVGNLKFGNSQQPFDISDGETLYFVGEADQGDYSIYRTDGTVDSTSRIAGLGTFQRGISNFLLDGEDLFFVNGFQIRFSNGVEYQRYQTETEVRDRIALDTTLATISNNRVTLVTHENDRLYFMQDRREGQGLELYYVNTAGDPSGVAGFGFRGGLDLTVTTEDVTVNTDDGSPINLTVYTLDGRLLTQSITSAGERNQILRHPGLLVYVFEQNGRGTVRKIMGR